MDQGALHQTNRDTISLIWPGVENGRNISGNEACKNSSSRKGLFFK